MSEQNKRTYPPEQTRFSFKAESQKQALQIDPQFEEYYDPREKRAAEQRIDIPSFSKEPSALQSRSVMPQDGYPQGKSHIQSYAQQPQGYSQPYAQQPQGYSEPYAQQYSQPYNPYPQPYPSSYSEPYAQQPQGYSQPYSQPQGYSQQYSQPYGSQPYPPYAQDPYAERNEAPFGRKREEYDYEGYEESSREAKKRARREAAIEAERSARLEEKIAETVAERYTGAEPKTKGSRNVFGKILLSMQFLLSAAVIILLLILDVLPSRYMLIAGVALALLFVLMLLFQSMRSTRGFGKGCSTFFILLLGFATFYLWQTNAAMMSMFSIKDLANSVAIQEDKPFVVYLSGNDSYGEIDVDENGNAIGRSDVNILLAVNPSTGKIAMITTPRDAYIYLPDYIAEGYQDKLTHVGNWGQDASKDVLGELYGVDVDYYVRINFSGFETIVDALGGVTVQSDYPYEFTTRDGGHTFYPGENQVDGEAALAFVRERYAFGDGDFQRGRNQMAMIQAILRKAMSPSILLTYTDLLEAVDGCMVTDVPRKQISTLVKGQLDNGTDWQITSMEVSGYGDMQYTYSAGEASVVWLDEESVAQAAQLLQDILEGR